MSTDLYGARVLSVDPDALRVRFQILVVYYDTGSRTHAELPDDRGFFFHLLWESSNSYLDDVPNKGRLADLVDVDTALDFVWVDANARRFVTGVDRLSTKNFPLNNKQWEGLHDFYYERDGRWKDEDLLVQAEYEVTVSDRRWLEQLGEGDSWGTTSFPLNADTWTAEDAPHLPDPARAVTLHPFRSATGDLEYDHLLHVEFSDDGKYLAACSDQGRVWVYDTADWSETVHAEAGDWIVPLLSWVPGTHTVVVKAYTSPGEPEEGEQWAYDVDARAQVEAPFEEGHLRSRDGAYRVLHNDAGQGGEDLLATDRSPHRRIHHADEWDPIQCKCFAGDGSRLFLGAQENLYIVDPATGEVVDKVMDASERLFTMAAAPDGSYLAVGGFSRKLSYMDGSERPHELCVWRVADKEIIMGHQLTMYTEALAWSPDGRMLAAALEPIGDEFGQGRSELVVYPMGPADGLL